MRAVLSSGAAMLLGAAVATADGQGSLRGSVSEKSVVESEEGVTLDALSDIFFALEEGSLDSTRDLFENTSSLGLSATVAAEGARCSAAWSKSVESVAPGCLGQCQQYGICGSIDGLVTAMRKKNKAEARRQVCQNKQAFDCLLWSSHRGKCQRLIDRLFKKGVPASACQPKKGPQRRLDEMPAPDTAAPEFVAQQNSAEQVAKEAAHEDSVVRHENMTLDYVGLAALSSEAQGCQISSGELRECGSKCLTKSGDARVNCITACLESKNHPHACSECYGRRSDCTLSNCLGKCALGPDSKGCTDCVHAKCGGDCR